MIYQFIFVTVSYPGVVCVGS